MGETYAKLHLPCMSEADAGVYECHGVAAGQEVVVATKVEVVGHAPHSGCLPRDRQASGPTITGWFSTVMIQSGETARLVCNLEVIHFITRNIFVILRLHFRAMVLRKVSSGGTLQGML